MFLNTDLGKFEINEFQLKLIILLLRLTFEMLFNAKKWNSSFLNSSPFCDSYRPIRHWIRKTKLIFYSDLESIKIILILNYNPWFKVNFYLLELDGWVNGMKGVIFFVSRRTLAQKLSFRSSSRLGISRQNDNDVAAAAAKVLLPRRRCVELIGSSHTPSFAAPPKYFKAVFLVPTLKCAQRSRNLSFTTSLRLKMS